MEIPVRLGTTEGGGEELEEYDSVFYEDIEAPKFVDLTAPDAARPTDDPSWFCLRVGCDQSHEHVDPEALHRNFVMRVMAARSPNVRLQKAISRRNQSSMLPKCPHSAPAKPPRTRMTRLRMTRLSTPKKETLAKSQAPHPVAEVCSKMKKLNLACREVPSRYLATPKITKNCEETAAVVKSAKRVQQPMNGKTILGISAKCGYAETDSGRQNINADENSCKRSARRNWERKEVQQVSRIEVEALQPDNHDDDDKENVSRGDQLTEQAVNRQDENMNQLENNENAPSKMVKRQNNKVIAEQGGKLKKTIQRPFRLRTDERQVLKEAHPERKPTVVQKNTMPVLKDENRRVIVQKNTMPAPPPSITRREPVHLRPVAPKHSAPPPSVVWIRSGAAARRGEEEVAAERPEAETAVGLCRSGKTWPQG